ncbi:MAG: hypothetical protein LBV63_03160 [Candidatus Methanoplasma sp.]|jgi:hypothetical protein|nr:hypothetical protein [Candidatus Methanoplasma sp.]
MNNRIRGVSGRTVVFAAIAIVAVIAVAGAATYIIVNSNTADDNIEETQSPGIGTEYVYTSGDGGEISSKVIGDSPDKYVFQLDGPDIDNVNVVLNKSEGTISWAGDPVRSDDGVTTSWEIQVGDRTIRLNVGKADGIYNITEIVRSGEKYALSVPDSTVTKPSAHTDTKFGETFVYDIDQKYTFFTDGYTSTVTASGTFTVVREADSSEVDGTRYYVFSSELDLKYILPSGPSALLIDTNKFNDIHTVTIFTAPGAVPELVGISLPGETGKEDTKLNGPDGAVSVVKYEYILSDKTVGMDVHAAYETYIGTSDGILYKSKTYGSTDTELTNPEMEYEFSLVYSHHHH